MPNQAEINPDPKGEQAILSALVELRDCARDFMHDVPGELVNKYTGLPSARRLRSAIVCANYAISQRKGRVVNTAAMLHALLGILNQLEGPAASMPCFIAATTAPGLKKAIEYAYEAINSNARNCDIYTTEETVDYACSSDRECVGCPSQDLEAPCVFCTVRWLLSPAGRIRERESANG
jgi:hypothetical protein